LPHHRWHEPLGFIANRVPFKGKPINAPPMKKAGD
jgi:hypothetical protein